jgi:hypothetical protein
VTVTAGLVLDCCGTITVTGNPASRNEARRSGCHQARARQGRGGQYGIRILPDGREVGMGLFPAIRGKADRWWPWQETG